jgi:glutamate synthase (NADPH/NADH) large chain
MKRAGYPQEQGLYRPDQEHDACGIGVIANIKGKKMHSTIQDGLSMLIKLEHRGGQGSDPESGDGAGIMTQIPDEFFHAVTNFNLPSQGNYGVGMLFLPQESQLRTLCEKKIEELVISEGQTVIGWRDVPVDKNRAGKTSKATMPTIKQLFIGKGKSIIDQKHFEWKLYVIRKQAENLLEMLIDEQDHTFYFASLSTQTIVYKGMLTPEQIDSFYLDLKDSRFKSAFSLVHSRFSTNTFPSWERAHPNRYLIHNGEINTLKGNVNWIKARESVCASSTFSKDLEKITPIINENGSDSSMLDNCLEFLTLTGRSLAHAAMMMVPEAWDNNDSITDPLRSFYEYHSHLMEPWDGPTAIAFTDGRQIGAMLDRNGLRPARYYVTSDDTIILSSEVGVLDVNQSEIITKGRLSPGKMLLIDLDKGQILFNDEIKESISQEKPYREWLNQNQFHIDELKESTDSKDESIPLLKYQKTFGYTHEEVTKNLTPMVTDGTDPIGSMGSDTPLAVLSNKPQVLYNYFKQLFAQVTNPPIDAIREKAVTSTMTLLGPEGNLLEPTAESCRRIRIETPILSQSEFIRLTNEQQNEFPAKRISVQMEIKQQGCLQAALDQLFVTVDKEIEDGAQFIVLSDKVIDENLAAVPALLVTSAIHQYLVKKGTRTKISIIVETGEARDVHQFATLLGYGADAIYPYLAYLTIKDLVETRAIEHMTYYQATINYIEAATSGIVKVLSKMGISTIQSYRGAQIFEAVGLGEELIDRYFTGTVSQLGGINIDIIEEEVRQRHKKAFQTRQYREESLEIGGDHQWRQGEEHHTYSPIAIHTLQQASRTNNYEQYKKFSELTYKENLTYFRNLYEFKQDETNKIPLDEVEPIESIVKKFKTGAMSYGSLSKEAHEALAIAMNRLGGKSNSGEGGEDPSRSLPDSNGDLRRSSIKQVASGRFGVNSNYLVDADEIQIKMAQGAKPGEGGHLPGKKVYPWIAEVRRSTPGVGLISPPPHHDIYSIEDLAQLIHDLKNANPSARISVKLVSKSGVGTIAAGVAKGLADVILISGYEGGTGASPKTSIKHAGLPWELGLAETHQTLLLNNLRDRVVIEADGKMMTGRDVVYAALLGAEEFGFATAPLVALGCIIMRACHKDTCPVGIATQNPELRKKFMGDPGHIVNYMTFIAQEVREIMAGLGIRKLEELVGRTDLLEVSERAKTHWKAKYLQLDKLLYRPQGLTYSPTKQLQNHKLETTHDYTELLQLCKPAIEDKKKVTGTYKIKNTNRVVGTILGSEITKKYGEEGLPENTITIQYYGSAGQSFGAFLPKGVTFKLEGDANDYVGKGLSGGKIIIHTPKEANFTAESNTIIGNVALYGATSGEAYIRGIAGERFCVRNSGANAVVDGLGDHGCEYMTGGKVVVLGEVGKNFAAGMSGGEAYVYQEDREAFLNNCNKEMIYTEYLRDEHEIKELKQLIQNHFNYTGSTKASYILRNWNQVVTKFVKIIPREYKHVIESLEQMTENGIEPKVAAMNVFKQQRKPNVQVLESNLEPV